MKPIDILNMTYEKESGAFFAELKTYNAYYSRCVMREQGNAYDVWYTGKQRNRGREVQAFMYDTIRKQDIITLRRFQDEANDTASAEICD